QLLAGDRRVFLRSSCHLPVADPMRPDRASLQTDVIVCILPRSHKAHRNISAPLYLLGSFRMSVAHRISPRLFSLALAALVTPCSPSQEKGAGFHGFPPAEVTVQAAVTRTFPVTFEYVGQTQGSKDVEVRARVTGIIEKRLFDEGAGGKGGQPVVLIHARHDPPQVAHANAGGAR